ncbi:MAG: hypothetical protein ACAH59_09840 [Pseudobdellovibrionaceae bacterium]
MTIWNEAVRLFFAVSALILVGMLSAPMGGNLASQPKAIKEITAAELESKPTAKSKNTMKIADRKTNKKINLKKS